MKIENLQIDEVNCFDENCGEGVKNGKVQVKYVDAEIPKTFIEDGETVTDLLPQTESEG